MEKSYKVVYKCGCEMFLSKDQLKSKCVLHDEEMIDTVKFDEYVAMPKVQGVGTDCETTMEQLTPTLESYRKILEDKLNLTIAKNKDYGNSVDKIYDKLKEAGKDPFIGLYVRLADKFSRFENLAIMRSSQQVSDESIEDTIIDLSNYCDLYLGWKRRQTDKRTNLLK